MDTTPNLRLPYIIAAQSQKHVTHNEAIRALDAFVQLSVRDRDLSTPPGAPAEGDRYIVPVAAGGAWAGQGGRIAAWQDGSWMFYLPAEGWLAWVSDEDRLVAWDGAGWISASGTNPAPLVGVNTVADAVNRLAAKSDSILFSHDDVTPGSGDLRLTLNKAAAGNTASYLFQSAYSGRAEMGLCGDEDLHLKVSPDGAVWHEALIVDRSTGAVRFPGGLVEATAQQRPVLLVPTTVRDIWRSDVDGPPTPRAYTIASVSGSTLTLSTAAAGQIISSSMHGVSMVRVWNMSKSPARSAWVDQQLAANQVRVQNAADVAGWLPGETIHLGDPNPTGTNALGMIAIDISQHLLAAHGTVFRQRGLKASVAPQGAGGAVSMDASGNGAVGTAFGVSSNSDGSRQSAFIDVFTTELSPVSNSNLLFVREASASGSALAATRLLRLVGIWV